MNQILLILLISISLHAETPFTKNGKFLMGIVLVVIVILIIKQVAF